METTLGIGTAVGDAIGTAAQVTGKVGMTVGKLGAGIAIGTAGAVGQAGAALGKAVGLPLLRGTGATALNTTKFLVNGYEGYGIKIGSPLKGTVKGAGKVAKNMVTYKGSHLEYNRYLAARGKDPFVKKGPSIGVSKLGVSILGGLAIAQSARGAYNAYMGSRMGTIDTKTTSLTPDYSPQEYKIQHPDFAGATGDLVFALGANRHG